MGWLKRVWDFCLHLSLANIASDPAQYGFPEKSPVGGSSIDKVGGSDDHGCVNSPQNRQCWFGDYNIETDYELVTPETGKVREYELVVSNQMVAPDGYMVAGMLINGQYPGPTLEADWGDTFRITVYNNLTNHNGTAMHWHGIRQFETNWQDGVAGITQCPIPPGSSYTYEFRATQYGTSWYHSHFSLQYPDGLVGGLKINGPTIMNYDVDVGPLLISDWLHKDAFSLYHLEMEGNPPTPNSNLMNGKGVYYCCPSLDAQCTGKQPRHVVNFEKDKVYKMSIVNTAVSTHFTFWIDGHNFSVVGTDFVPIQPYNTSTINVAIGQRYDIIVTANASMELGTNFWIHARDCAQVGQISTLGIIRYDNKSDLEPWTPPLSRLCYGCEDEPTASMVPVVPRTVGSNVNPFSESDYLNVALQGFPNTSDPNSRLKKWILANSSLYLDWEQPSLNLITLLNDTTGAYFPPDYAPIFLNYTDKEWVYFLIQGDFTTKDMLRYKGKVPVAHPIHLHGHDFVILAQANATFDANNVTLNLHNPTRRDVVMLPVNGYVLIAFQVDNPGSWLMHCHIAWHASSGLALQFVEKADEISDLMYGAGVVPKFQDQCMKWSAYYTFVNEPAQATQEDSGV